MAGEAKIKLGNTSDAPKKSAAKSVATRNAELEALMTEYGNDVLKCAYMYLGDKDAAEDVFQQVFLKVYQKYEEFRGESSVKTWLIRITINTCKDSLKTAWNKNTIGFTEAIENTLAGEDEFEQVEAKVDGKPVREAVMSLPNKYREIILCLFYRDMSTKETAEALGIPEGTVKSRASRAKIMLKKIIERRNG